MVGVVGGIPLGRLLVDDVQVAGILPVHGPGQRRLAVHQGGAVERREQPLVRIDDERVSMLDPGVRGPDAGREQACPAVRAIHVEPELALCRNGRETGKVIDDAGVGRAGRRHDRRERTRITVGRDSGADGIAGEPVVIGRYHESVHLEQAERVADR